MAPWGTAPLARRTSALSSIQSAQRVASQRACKRLGLKHLKTKPYTPKTNGKAECFIQTALREWAYGECYHRSDQRRAELPLRLRRYNWHRPHGSFKAMTPVTRLGLTEGNVLSLHS